MHLQCEERVPNDVRHGLIPKDSKKLRFNPGFYTSVINLELPFSAQSRYKLRPSLHYEICNTMRGAFHCTWVGGHPGPHWMSHILGTGQSLKTSGPRTSFSPWLPLSHPLQTKSCSSVLRWPLQQKLTQVLTLASFAETSRGWGHTEPFPSSLSAHHETSHRLHRALVQWPERWFFPRRNRAASSVSGDSPW